MMVVQATLSSGTSRLTAWVEQKCKVGQRVTLKNSDDPTQLWRVDALSEPRESAGIHTDWNVGGVTSRR